MHPLTAIVLPGSNGPSYCSFSGTTGISALQIVVHDFTVPLCVIADLIVRTEKLLGFQPPKITGHRRPKTYHTWTLEQFVNLNIRHFAIFH